MNIDKLIVTSGPELLSSSSPLLEREPYVSVEINSMMCQFGGQLSHSEVARDAIWDPSTSESQQVAALKVEEVKDVEKWHKRIQQNETCLFRATTAISET